MMTVKEVSRLTGVSVRALHHYDETGLLKPAAVTDAGYRLYDEGSLERLGHIMLFKELGFGLRDIKNILDAPGFDKSRALEGQIALLRAKKERLESIIDLAEEIKKTGDHKMDFKVFDSEKIKRYSEEAKKAWGETEAYREFSQKTAGRSETAEKALAGSLMDIFKEFGGMKALSPEAPEVQKQVKKLQDFITANYYTCTDEILGGLGKMYCAGGEMTENIDAAGGRGTADFAAKAIAAYLKE